MDKLNRLHTSLSGVTGSAKALGRRLRAAKARKPVPHWSDYLRETQAR